jgi:D-glycero-beta-D-manno-heptose-7-phosphate kinase
MFLKKSIIEKVLNDFSKMKVVVVGDYMLDRYVWGSVGRISPEAPVPILDVYKDDQMPGGAGNVVLNLLKLDINCKTVGLVGDDPNGKLLQFVLEEHGADTEGLIATSERQTTVKTRFSTGRQQMLRVDREVKTIPSKETQDRLLKTALSVINGADAIVLQDYNKGVLTKDIIHGIIKYARDNDIVITVDPKEKNFFEYKGVTLFKPNLQEASRSLGRVLETDEELFEAGKELLDRLEADKVLITRGSSGMSLFTRDGKVENIPTVAAKISDVCGAGDTVIAILSAALAAGFSGVDAARLANQAAGYVVGCLGVVPITKEALLDTGI